MRSTPWGTYAQIAEQLRERLAGLAPGSALPSETSLATEFGVVRNTVRRALAERWCAGTGSPGAQLGRAWCCWKPLVW